MSMEGPPPKKRTEFIPGRPEGAYARRVIRDGIHTQEYEVQTPDGEAIPVHPADLARASIPWAGTETVTSDDPAYRRIIETAYRKREMTPPKKDEPDMEPPEPEEEAKSTHFIPGRETAVAERVFDMNEGRADLSQQHYRVRFPDGQEVMVDAEDLAHEGVVTEDGQTIFPSDREYPNLIEAAYRKREGTTRKEMQARLRSAIDAYGGADEAPPVQPPLASSTPEDDLRQEHSIELEVNAEHSTESRGAVESPAVPEEIPETPAEGKRHESSPSKTEKHERDHGKHEHHDHVHGHGHDHHGEPWHLPRNRYEWEEAGVAVLLGAWNLVKGLYHLHQWMVHATGYILTGDNKHPWQTLWKNISGEFKKGLGLKGGGGGGGHGGGGGGGHH